jgi:hypothetical protein
MKNYQDVFWINLSALLIGIILYFISCQKTELLTAAIATGISLSLGLRQYKTENDKIFKELFLSFNEKYDTKFNDKLIEIDKNSNANPTFVIDEKDTPLIIDYLNLCAEEYLWYTKGRIPKTVWASWEKGMIYYLSIDSINKIVLNEKSQKDSYYGLFNKIGQQVKNWC